MKKVFSLLMAVVIGSSVFAQMRTSNSGHDGEVVGLFKETNTKENSFYTIGKDGFVSHWNANGSGERYQISSQLIKFAAMNPSKKEIAVYETDGNTSHVISVWDLQKMTKKFEKQFDDSLLSLTYSKKGTYIIAGTSTEKGTVFLNSSNGNIESPIKDSMNMMSFIETASSEKSMMSYSLTGTICFYSFADKKLLKKIQTVQGLKSPLFFGKYRYMAGISGNSIKIINIQNGKVILEQNANNPYIFINNDNLYYYDFASGKSGNLYIFPMDDSQVKPCELFQAFTFTSKDSINKAAIFDNLVAFTSTSGDVYTADLIQNETRELSRLSTSKNQKIKDAAFINADVYILTDNGIYKTNANKTAVTEELKNSDFNNMISHNGNLILWSTEKNLPVYSFNPDSKKLDKLFTPQGQLVTVKSCAGQLIEIESATTVKKYDFEKKSLTEAYYGSGIQDAVMLTPEEMYIAKTVTNSIDSSLLFVNTRTHETLPLKIDVDYVYSLGCDFSDSKDTKSVYALGIKNNGKNLTTVLIKYNTEKKTTDILYDYKTLNMHAFNLIDNQNMYSNVFDSSISSVNTKSKKFTSYNRSVSLPAKVVADSTSLIFINNDGSISILKPGNSSIVNDWYITNDKELIITK